MKNIRFYIGLLIVVGIVACGLILMLSLALKAEGIGPLFAAGDTLSSSDQSIAATSAVSRFVMGAAPTDTPTALPTQSPTPSPQPTATVQRPTAIAETVLPTPTETATEPPSPAPTLAPSLPVAEPPPEQLHWATRLVIPTLGVDAPVLPAPIENNTWNVDHLDQAVGHLERTAGPGEAGNIVLAGHITLAPDGRDGPFINLGALTQGDKVIVYQRDRTFTYEIDYMDTVKPSDVEVTYPTEQSRLTLLTCLNYDHQLEHYADRLVVVGHLLQ